jgi:hypothetical protein
MANNSHYTNKKNYTVRRLILAIALVIAIGAVMIKLSSGIFSTGAEQSPTGDNPIVKVTPAVRQPATVEKPQPPVAVAQPQPAPVLPEPVKPKPSPGEQLFNQAGQALAAGNYIDARGKLSQAVASGLTQQQDTQARQMLNAAADKWLFSRNICNNDNLCFMYKMASGDRLTQICKENDVPWQLIQRINNIPDPKKLRAGENIKLLKGPFHVTVDRKRFLMSVYLGDIMVRSYPVGLGAQERQTPTGLWLVKLKQPSPAWHDPETNKNYLPDDPENPLGERWIALEGLEGDAVGRTGFGIHGTIKPDEIGKSASRGCIRLFNKDVEELYDMLLENKSKVTVID